MGCERPTTLAQKFLFPQRFISTQQWFPRGSFSPRTPVRGSPSDPPPPPPPTSSHVRATCDPPTAAEQNILPGLRGDRPSILLASFFFFLSLSSCRSWMNGRGDGRGGGECEITGAWSNSPTVNTNRVCV